MLNVKLKVKLWYCDDYDYDVGLRLGSLLIAMHYKHIIIVN